MTEDEIDARIAEMRRETFLRHHAGMRFEDRARRRWEDADGQVVEPFDDEVPWPQRQAADLARWGIDAPPFELFGHL